MRWTRSKSMHCDDVALMFNLAIWETCPAEVLHDESTVGLCNGFRCYDWGCKLQFTEFSPSEKGCLEL
jgi:hypothetical protein